MAGNIGGIGSQVLRRCVRRTGKHSTGLRWLREVEPLSSGGDDERLECDELDGSKKDDYAMTDAGGSKNYIRSEMNASVFEIKSQDDAE